MDSGLIIEVSNWIIFEWSKPPWSNQSDFVIRIQHYSDVIMAFQNAPFRLFTQAFVQAQIKENDKAPLHWPLFEGNPQVTGEFPAQRASNAENVFIWWRHHEPAHVLPLSGTRTLKVNSRRPAFARDLHFRYWPFWWGTGTFREN